MPSARPRGFSFIEVLIVMGIISVLVGGVVVGIGIWAKKQPEFKSQNRVDKVKLLIENWRHQFEMYPPSDVTRISDMAGGGTRAEVPDNQTNAGIEAIYQALTWPGFRNDPAWEEGELGNTDEDKLRKAVNKRNQPELFEILDGYGSPLVYFSREDYAKFGDSGMPYVNFEGDTVEAKPWRNADGSFINPDTFQIYSMGPDGIPNTDDDIVPWKR